MACEQRLFSFEKIRFFLFLSTPRLIDHRSFSTRNLNPLKKLAYPLESEREKETRFIEGGVGLFHEFLSFDSKSSKKPPLLRKTALKNVNTRRNTRTEIPGDGHVHRVFIVQCITTRLETLYSFD